MKFYCSQFWVYLFVLVGEVFFIQVKNTIRHSEQMQKIEAFCWTLAKMFFSLVQSTLWKWSRQCALPSEYRLCIWKNFVSFMKWDTIIQISNSLTLSERSLHLYNKSIQQLVFCFFSVCYISKPLTRQNNPTLWF
jgi:hypothetical protein